MPVRVLFCGSATVGEDGARDRQEKMRVYKAPARDRLGDGREHKHQAVLRLKRSPGCTWFRQGSLNHSILQQDPWNTSGRNLLIVRCQHTAVSSSGAHSDASTYNKDRSRRRMNSYMLPKHHPYGATSNFSIPNCLFFFPLKLQDAGRAISDLWAFASATGHLLNPGDPHACTNSYISYCDAVPATIPRKPQMLTWTPLINGHFPAAWTR